MLGSIANSRLLEPRTLRDALRMLDQEGPLVPMAGCTDLYVSLNFGTLKATRFLNLWGLDELRSIAVRDGLLSIGALSTYTDIIRSRAAPAADAAAAAQETAACRFRIAARWAVTSPTRRRSDTLPVLAAAMVVVAASAAGTRRIPFVGSTGLPVVGSAANELILRVEIPWFAVVNGSARSCARGPGDLQSGIAAVDGSVAIRRE
jgi:carbon-monoxide dehydrogenase medium subunit